MSLLKLGVTSFCLKSFDSRLELNDLGIHLELSSDEFSFLLILQLFLSKLLSIAFTEPSRFLRLVKIHEVVLAATHRVS